jgi:hypothetical protein
MKQLRAVVFIPVLNQNEIVSVYIETLFSDIIDL